MAMDNVSRRSLLKAAGSAGIVGGLPETALAFQTTGQVTHEVASGPGQQNTPKHTVKFAVIGLDHNHINGITDTIRRSGGELVSVHSTNPQALAGFQKRYGGVRVARSEDEYVNIVTALATDLPRLSTLRRELRERMRRSPILDAPRFARNMESLYRTIWQRWCAP